MKRTTLSLLVVCAVLALVVGVATLAKPSAGHAATDAPRTVPVSYAQVLCPPADQGIGITTTISAATVPGTAAAGPNDGGAVAELGNPTAVHLTPSAPGQSSSASVDGALVPMVGTATGAYAPGYTVQETTRISTGPGKGLSGVLCTAPATEQWFVGTSTDPSRTTYVDLVNASAVPASVDLEMWGPGGPITSDAMRGITVAAGGSQHLLLSSFMQSPADVLTVHVISRTGRVSASLSDRQNDQGSDWLPVAAAPSQNVVVPGLPGDASDVQLSMMNPGDSDIDVAVQVAGKSNTFKPAGHESVTLPRGQTTVVDLGQLTAGDASAIELSSTRGPFVAGVRVTRSGGGGQDVAYLAGAPTITGRAVLADNRTGGTVSPLLMLTAPGTTAAKVQVSALLPGTAPVTQEVDVPPGTTAAVTDFKLPPGTTQFGLLVQPLPGSGPVVGARMLTDEGADKIPLFTEQPLLDATETANLPHVSNDQTIQIPQK